MRKKWSKLILAVAFIFLAGTIIGNQAVAADQPMKWKGTTLYPRGTAYTAVYQAFADNVKAMSGGRILIDIIYDGEGVAATEILGAVRSGVVEMGFPYMALHAGELPAGLVELGLPGALTDYLAIRTIFHTGGWKETMSKAYEKFNCKWLADWSSPGTYLLTKKPINKLDDLKALKIRAPGLYGKMLNNLGATPVTMAFSEVYTSLATGVIDGVDGCNIIDHRDGKFYEAAKYMYPLPLTGAQTCPVLINLDVWKKLPPDLQAILQTAALWGGDEWGMKSLVWERGALQEMKSKGLQMSPAPSDEDKVKWRKAGQAVWPEYEEKDPVSKEMIKLQREFISNMGL